MAEDVTNTLSAEDQSFVDSLSAMDAANTQNQTPPDDAQNGADNTPPADGANNAQTDGDANTGGDDDISKLLGDDPKDANKAFANMRVTNKKLTDIVNNMASVIGIDPTSMSPEELEATMNQAILEAQSQKTNVPREILERLNYLEAQNTARETEQLHNAARNGILSIKEKFGATQEDLTDFISSLAQDGIDPMHQRVDLETEYVRRNFDKVVAAQVEAKVNAELERREKAATKASTPSNATGQTPEDGTAISSVKDLEKAFANLTN